MERVKPTERFPQTAQMQVEMDKLWTTADVMKHFGITLMTLHMWRRNRQFPTIVLRSSGAGGTGANIRFLPEDVEGWKKRNYEWLRRRSVFRPQLNNEQDAMRA